MTGEHLDDGALSATLDGEATAAESAHVDACTPCRVRVDELREAANSIGTPLPAVDAQQRDRAVATAMAALPTSIESRRRRPPTWLFAAAAAAAAIVAIGVLGPLLSRDGDVPADSAAKVAAPTQDRSADADAGAGAGNAEDDASTLAAPAAPLDGGELGTVTAGGTLRDLVAPALAAPKAFSERQPATTATTATTAGTPTSCASTIASDDLGPLRLHGVASVDGVRVDVFVYDLLGHAPELRAIAVDPRDCRVVRSETFPAP